MSNFYIIPILTKESYCYLDEEFIDFAFWKQDGIEMFVEISVEHEKKPCWKEINELEFMLEFKKMKANLCGYEIYERESYVCDMGKIAIATIDYFISNIKTLENLLIDINQKVNDMDETQKFILENSATANENSLFIPESCENNA